MESEIKLGYSKQAYGISDQKCPICETQMDKTSDDDAHSSKYFNSCSKCGFEYRVIAGELPSGEEIKALANQHVESLEKTILASKKVVELKSYMQDSILKSKFIEMLVVNYKLKQGSST